MNKTAALFTILLLIAVLIPADGIDVVVMVDTSESLFPYFHGLVDYLVRDLLENKLHRDDTFHLLTFDSAPETEFDLQIEDVADVEKIINRILILKALGQYTDLIAAIEFLVSYTQDLSGSQKLILLLTDGIHDPPPGSPNQLGYEQLMARLLESAETINMEGWDVHILQTPELTAAGSSTSKTSDSGETSAESESFEQADPDDRGIPLLKDLAELLETDVFNYDQENKENILDRLIGLPSFEFPDTLGEIERRFKVPLRIINHHPEDLRIDIQRVEDPDGRNLLTRGRKLHLPGESETDLELVLRLPRDFSEGSHRLPVILIIDSEGSINPSGTLNFSYHPAQFPWRYILYGLLALAAVFILILFVYLIRLLISRLPSIRLIPKHKSDSLLHRAVLLKVAFQNSHIGMRNIHRIPKGASRSVGGGRSTFLIYYVPVPPRIGDIRNEGDTYTFIPIRKKYFPDLSEPLYDCLNKEILAFSKLGHLITFQFREYVSPTEEINRLMLSIRRSEDTKETSTTGFLQSTALHA